MNHKNCKRCLRTKPETDFYLNSGSICKKCKKSQASEWRSRNKTRVKATDNARYWANLEERRGAAVAYYHANKAKIVPAAKERRRERRQDNPSLKLTHGIQKRMSKVIKGGCPRDWKDLIGYDPKLLVPHLEALFEPWMSWSNYGTEWHVDHRRPVSSFRLPEEIRECWALSNLRPLAAIENIKKGARWNPNAEDAPGASHNGEAPRALF